MLPALSDVPGGFGVPLGLSGFVVPPPPLTLLFWLRNMFNVALTVSLSL